MATALFWFRKDLRLMDNPAWTEVCKSNRVLPVFILEPELLSNAGTFRKRQFFANLGALAEEITRLGGKLNVITGPAEGILPRYVKENRIDSIYLNADTTPFSLKRDKDVFKQISVPVHSYWGGFVHPPETILTQKGEISKVFTPFYKKWISFPAPPALIPKKPTFIDSDGDDGEMASYEGPSVFPAGYHGARERLERFLEIAERYQDFRNFPSENGTSMLSSDLHFGTMGPREILQNLSPNREGHRQFIRQLAWRDWYAHLLYANQQIPYSPVNPVYENIRWREDNEGLEHWKNGQTGYPIVDAGMRQLLTSGWMHNRVRMITASFLVKHLLVDWRIGERYFREILVDGDVAQNSGNWQWVAGTGFDAAPYFRVFNPILQSEKFDPSGSYIRKWVPELNEMPDSCIHSPWTVEESILGESNVVLGETYPYPIVEHVKARQRVLDAYKTARDTEG